MTALVRRALRDATRAVERVGGSYAVVGGLAVGAWSAPRATRDVDLYTDLGEEGRGRLKLELEARGFHVPAMEEELARFGVFRARSAAGVFVDFFDAAGPLGAAVLANRRRAKLGRVAVWFAGATELAALKAFSDRPRDEEDLFALVSSGSVDLPGLERWAVLLDEATGTTEVRDRVQRAFARRPR